MGDLAVSGEVCCFCLARVCAPRGELYVLLENIYLSLHIELNVSWD